jgi:thymidylate synthase (FAD)
MTNPTILDHGFLNHYAHDNDDLTVVNAARVSMGKRVDKILLAGTPEAQAREDATGIKPDDGLIEYLARHRHWTPFGQVRMSIKTEAIPGQLADWAEDEERRAGFVWKRTGPFTAKFAEYQFEGSLWGWLVNPPPINSLCRVHTEIARACPLSFAAIGKHIKAWGTFTDYPGVPLLAPSAITLHIRWPMFVAVQALRHTVGVVPNYESWRYISPKEQWYTPEVWRGAPTKGIKQGSAGAVKYAPMLYRVDGDVWSGRAMTAEEVCLDEYRERIEAGVCKEQARGCLPTETYTECIATFTRPALARFIRQRIKPDAQWEIRQYAERALAVGVEVFGGEFAKECESQ